jgi:hypothetical protein
VDDQPVHQPERDSDEDRYTEEISNALHHTVTKSKKSTLLPPPWLRADEEAASHVIDYFTRKVVKENTRAASCPGCEASVSGPDAHGATRLEQIGSIMISGFNDEFQVARSCRRSSSTRRRSGCF